MQRKTSHRAADKWTAALLEIDPYQVESGQLSNDQRRVRQLARAAFLLYSIERGPGWKISEWEWPFRQLEERKHYPGSRPERVFGGMEPWAVLFHRAVTYALS